MLMHELGGLKRIVVPSALLLAVCNSVGDLASAEARSEFCWL
jgi:hypothetical protein